MKDIDIRNSLKVSFLKDYYTDGHSRVVEEFNLPVSKARIDMAVINGYLHGYEIKSASDTLQRLPNQVQAYSKVFDFLYIITEGKYYNRILDTVPSWIGIYVCHENKGICNFEEIRPASINNYKNGFFIAKLLWREEIIDILTNNEIKFKKKDRNWLLCETLSTNMPIDQLSDVVRKKLKERNEWKIKLREDYEVK